MAQVVLSVPDFRDPETGTEYTDIEVVVINDGDIRDAARLAGTVTKASLPIVSTKNLIPRSRIDHRD